MKLLNNKINMKHFFKEVDRGSLLMLDYDGTLAPLLKERMHAYPYPGVTERLQALSKKQHNHIVIVSGRGLSDLEALLGMPTPPELWGSHGLERRLSNGKKSSVPISKHLQKGLQEGIAICQQHVKSEWCEIKPFAVAFHWRDMDPLERTRSSRFIKREWAQICMNYALEIHHFDGGIELRPVGYGKGDVVKTLLEETPTAYAVAYLGDDITDEEAFKALGNRGLKVLVRKQIRPTLADLYLVPPLELLTFLDQWGGA